MPSDTIVVTGADARYSPLMREMIASLLTHPESAAIDLGVLDCGLGTADLEWCRDRGARLVAPGWDVAFADRLTVPPSYRAMTARPYLKRYFPGYATYIWLDADVWVQNWAAIDLLRDAARLGDIALVPEVHRSYANLRDSRDDFEAANGRAYAEAFGPEAAARLIRRPLNNAGVFAISAASPAWSMWGEVLADAATRSANMVDQIALNVAIYDHGLREVRLPATCNWIAHLAPPAWHELENRLTEPDPPYAPIGILHLTLGTKWADSVALPRVGAPGVPGARTISRSLRFPG
ncbi:MAG: hypothetical protein R3D44_08060 [Hyphomicrobiaceae bacterium]